MNTETISIGKNLGTAMPASITSTGAAGCVSAVKDIELTIVSPVEWDVLAAEFSDIIPEQTGSFNAGHWGADKIECVAMRRHGELVGGCTVIVRGMPFTATGVAVVKWGPVWRRKEAAPDIGLYKSVISKLVEEYCDLRGFHLTIMPPSIPGYDEGMCLALGDLRFTKGAGLAAPERYIVNTHQDPEALMASFDQKWRYNLRKAHKNNFEICFAEGEEGLAAFMDLYDKMIARKRFLDSSAISSLENFVRNSPGGTTPSIVLVSHEGSATAGGVFFTAGEMASYMFGATDDRALRLKAGYALHWWIAEHLCRHGRVKWYDLGGNDLDTGLHQFKKGMVGKSGHVLQAPARYQFASRPTAKLFGETVFRLRDAKASASRTAHKMKQWLRK